MPEEQIEQSQPTEEGAERKTLSTPDAQDARNAEARQVKAVQNLNQNKSDGSAGGDNKKESIRIMSDGKVVTSREDPKTEKEIVALKPQDSISLAELKELANTQTGYPWAQSVLKKFDSAQKLPAGNKKSEALAKAQDMADLMARRGPYALESKGLKARPQSSQSAEHLQIAPQDAEYKPSDSYVLQLSTALATAKTPEEAESIQVKVSIDYMTQKGQEALAALQEPETDQVLIASNIDPAAPKLEHMQQYQDIQSDVPTEGTVAWDPREWAGNQLKNAEKSTKKTVQSLGRAAKYGEATAKDADLQIREDPPKGGDYWHPHRGREDDFVSFPACAAAVMPFENVRIRMGEGPGHIDPDLIAAMMRNEQFYYKQIGDVGQDNYIRIHGNLDILQDDTYSIGPAQMQIRNVHKLLEQFPKQLGQYKDDPLRAVERPGDAPMFVAAYMSNIIEHLENHKNPGFSAGVWNNIAKHWKDGDANGALILSFNPDPNQIAHVTKQLQIIKAARGSAN